MKYALLVLMMIFTIGCGKSEDQVKRVSDRPESPKIKDKGAMPPSLPIL